MDADAKKTALRMIPYGIYVLTAADVATAPEGRPDDAVLWMKDLGDNVFYGG
jgi:hypothetical protein